MKNLLTLIISSFIFLNVTLADTFKTVKDGDWNSKSTWENNKVPSVSKWPGDDVIIAHDVTYNGNLSIQQGANLTVQKGGMLIVTGKFKTGGKGKIVIQSGGILKCPDFQHNAWSGSFIVDGTLICTPGKSGKGDIKVNGVAKIEINGELEASSFTVGGSGKVSGFGGTMVIDNDLKINGGSGFKLSDMVILVDGNFIRSGGPDVTITNSDVTVKNSLKGTGGGIMYQENTYFNVGKEMELAGSFTIKVSGRGELFAKDIKLRGAAAIKGREDGGWLSCISVDLTPGTEVRCVDNIRVYNSNNFQEMANPLDLGFGAQNLPIELSYFRSTLLENKILHTWETASELNNDFFTIEYSTDGNTWETLTTTEGAGTTTNAQYYEFEDTKTYFGNVIYFRLQQTDFDGSTSYSSVNVIELTTTKQVDINVYPNPVVNHLTVSGLPQKEIENVRLINLNGQNSNISYQYDGYELNATLENNLPSGIYNLVVQYEEQTVTKQIIVK